jgi:hypothetical protein
MKRVPLILAAVVASAVGASVLFLGNDAEAPAIEVESVEPHGGGAGGGLGNLEMGEYRPAVADQPCPSEGQPGYDYMRAQCAYTRTVKNHCVCVTSNDETLTGEVPDFVSTLPDSYFRRVAVCETDTGERGVYYAELGVSVPPGWTCQVILAKALWRATYRPAKSRLLNALRSACCADCTGECFVNQNSWGLCPYCLLDANCVDYCPEP